VIEVDTGHVLARAQVPDLDPGDPSWQDQLAHDDGSFARQFWGAYGPGADKTGAVGFFQAGAVGSLVTALAAARSGWKFSGLGCQSRTADVFACATRDAEGPSFTLPGWSKPIHDARREAPHGQLDAVQALSVGCNTYFAQLGLRLGPARLRDLVRAGVDVGFGNRRIPFDPGPAGSRQLASTAFGQGAMAMNVMQAARVVAAIGGGGVYRRCSAGLELAEACREIHLLADPAALVPILAGMRRVMTEGVGVRLPAVDGVRLYGKPASSDAPAFRGEELYRLPARGAPPPHSWFVGLAEPSSAPECAATTRGRIAIAVVVPRGGGGGALRAGQAALEIVHALPLLGYLGADPPGTTGTDHR
jgi:cell division protein FtsI/penicillin-binding protein 2